MATNMTREDNYRFSVICTHPATPLSGQPVRFGSRTGVALTNEATTNTDASGNALGYTSVDFGPRSWNLSVKGVNDSGNSAVAAGDELFYVDADINDGTGFLSKKASGYFFGYAGAAVTSGATATIEVHHMPSPGAGTLGTGTVGTTQLQDLGVATGDIANNAITAAKLTTTLATGYIPIPLASFREISANDYINTAGDAGMLSKNTTPILERVNGATDKKARISWAASNSDEIAFDFAYPPDLDDTAALTVNLLMVMAGATDTPTVAISYFENVGDTNAGGNTAALSNTLAKKSVTIAASDVGPYPAAASIGIVVGAHTTDACYLYGAWIEYTRK